MKIRCENTICIYEEKGKCLLDEISLDSAGLCRECIEVEQDAAELLRKKRALRDELDRRDGV